MDLVVGCLGVIAAIGFLACLGMLRDWLAELEKRERRN
jgi:hypothetical protein